MSELESFLKNTEALDKEHKIRYKINQSSKGNIYWSEVTARGNTPEETEKLLRECIRRLKELEKDVNG